MVKQELENIRVQEEEEAKVSSKVTTKPLLPPQGGEPFGPEVDWGSLAADFDFETLLVSQDS